MSVLDQWIEKKLQMKLRDRKELEKWQLTQIRSFLSYARENSPFYSRTYADLSLPESLQDFSTFPLTDAADLQEHGLQMLCVSQSQISRVVTLHTSGTAGRPKRIFFTEKDQELTVDFFHNGMKELTRPGDTVMVFLPCTPKGSVGDLLCTGLQRLGAHPVRYGLITDLEDCARTLIKQQASCAVGVPVQLLALGAFMQKQHLFSPLKTLLLSTDYLSPIIRQRIEATLSCQVFNHFGMTETGLGGALEYGTRLISEISQISFPSMVQTDALLFSDPEVVDYTICYDSEKQHLFLKLLKLPSRSRAEHPGKKQDQLRHFFSEYASAIEIQEIFIENKIPPYGGKRKPEFYHKKKDTYQ